jgi:hypothetical protein
VRSGVSPDRHAPQVGVSWPRHERRSGGGTGRGAEVCRSPARRTRSWRWTGARDRPLGRIRPPLVVDGHQRRSRHALRLAAPAAAATGVRPVRGRHHSRLHDPVGLDRVPREHPLGLDQPRPPAVHPGRDPSPARIASHLRHAPLAGGADHRDRPCRLCRRGRQPDRAARNRRRAAPRPGRGRRCRTGERASRGSGTRGHTPDLTSARTRRGVHRG